MSGGFHSVVAAQEPAKPPEGAVWFDPAKPDGPKIRPNAFRDWRRNNERKFRSALGASNPSSDQRKELVLGAQIYTYRMTDPGRTAGHPQCHTMSC